MDKVCGGGLNAARGLQLPWKRSQVDAPNLTKYQGQDDSSHADGNAKMTDNKAPGGSTAESTGYFSMSDGKFEGLAAEDDGSCCSDSSDSSCAESFANVDLDDELPKTMTLDNLPHPSTYLSSAEHTLLDRQQDRSHDGAVVSADVPDVFKLGGLNHDTCPMGSVLSRAEHSPDENASDKSSVISQDDTLDPPPCAPRTNACWALPDPSELFPGEDIQQMRADLLSTPSRCYCKKIFELSEYLTKNDMEKLRMSTEFVFNGPDRFVLARL